MNEDVDEALAVADDPWADPENARDAARVLAAEVKRLREVEQRVRYVRDHPAGWTSARAITRHILGDEETT